MRPGDVFAALGLLSRLPIPVDMDRATQRGANAAWAYPIAGAVIAVLACAVGQIALWIGVPVAFSAGLMLATIIILTGAMHEDGLADTVDGFWGGWTVERRLEIMKDSHIGTYGVIALVLSLGLRWYGLSLLVGADWFWLPLIVIAMLSRSVMVAIMSRLPHARNTGLSHTVGRPSQATALIALILAGLAALFALQLVGAYLIFIALGAAFVCSVIAKAKIGGQTGDVLGATQQITEITLLIAFGAFLT